MSLWRFDTELPADSVEFCPQDNIFVCGTYKLQENTTSEPQTRVGRCLTFRADEDGSNPTELHQFDTPGILDMKWRPVTVDGQNPILAIANAEGYVTSHTWDPTQEAMVPSANIRCVSDAKLCLSLDWSSDLSPLIAVSLSNGHVCTTDLVTIVDSWEAHSFEAWTTSWDTSNPYILYSGGDDCKLKGWDRRQSFSSPTFVNRRFDAGVTSIQTNPHMENTIAVGNYNDTLSIFDKRKISSHPLSQIDVGGGVWRIKWHPNPLRPRDVLLACMHDGFKVVRLENDMTSGEVVKRFDEHESLAYGVDWNRRDVHISETLIASCSFYDHKLHTWRG